MKGYILYHENRKQHHQQNYDTCARGGHRCGTALLLRRQRRRGRDHRARLRNNTRGHYRANDGEAGNDRAGNNGGNGAGTRARTRASDRRHYRRNIAQTAEPFRTPGEHRGKLFRGRRSSDRSYVSPDNGDPVQRLFLPLRPSGGV